MYNMCVSYGETSVSRFDAEPSRTQEALPRQLVALLRLPVRACLRVVHPT